jgi:hypothetical protein
MDWLKLSADFWTHPKLQGLSHQAYRVVTSSWGYAARHETGGHIPATAYRVLGATQKVVRELETAGLWHPNGDGSEIHDWSDHQEAAVELRAERERKRAYERERKRAYRERTQA